MPRREMQMHRQDVEGDGSFEMKLPSPNEIIEAWLIVQKPTIIAPGARGEMYLVLAVDVDPEALPVTKTYWVVPPGATIECPAGFVFRRVKACRADKSALVVGLYEMIKEGIQPS